MKKDSNKNLAIVLFLLPAVFLFVGILLYPIISSVYNSLFYFEGLTKDNMKFVGFKNYIDLFTTTSIELGPALKNVFILAFVSVFIQLPLSLGLALMLGKGIKGERIFLSIYFMPVLISSVVIGFLWETIYKPGDGVLAVIFEKLGMTDILPQGGLLANKSSALVAVMIPVIWQYVGYHMLLMYAGVKGVSPDLREAAMLDGATDWQVDKYVVIPSIKQIIKVSVIFAVTGSFKTYDLIKAFAKDTYGVSYRVPTITLGRFVSVKGGYSSAIAVILIILCFTFAILINKIFKERDPYGKK